MKKTVWTFGLISGAVLSAMMLLTMPFADRIGFDRMEVIGYTTMVLSFLLVFFGIRSYRDNVGGGTIGFGRALAVGLLIVLIASVCYVATWELIYFQLAPGFMANYQAYAVEQARASGATPAEIQQKIVEMQQFAKLYQNPAINAAMTFAEPLPVGLVMTLVSAGILRRRRRSSEPALTTAVA
jgi:hypothetical protein